MPSNHKIIGTSIPLFALRSQKSASAKHGTIGDGLLFLDWLKITGQHAWQLLPIHETHLVPGTSQEHVSSPYKGYGIGIDRKYTANHNRKPSQQELSDFLTQHAYWLPDYALFCALRDYFGTDTWTQWDTPLKNREPAALQAWREKLSARVEQVMLEQWAVHQEYSELKEKAGKEHIILIGDMSFYLPLQSPLVWKYQDLFRLHSAHVSGLPLSNSPMYGRQVWGHPLYDWDRHTPEVLSLFSLRLQYLSSCYDVIRIDHANGFFLYGAVHRKDPKLDEMRTGPGLSAMRQIIETAKMYSVDIYAEDAAIGLEDLRNAMESLEIPGFRVLRYAYNEKDELFLDDYADLASYPEKNLAFTTTHDTETLLGFIRKLHHSQQLTLAKHLGIPYIPDDKEFAALLRKKVLDCPSQTVIIPMQDWLLTTERINTPGTEKLNGDSNWKYRLNIPIESLPETVPY